MRVRSLLCLALAGAAAAGCGGVAEYFITENDEMSDAGTTLVDAGTTTDAGSPTDAGDGGGGDAGHGELDPTFGIGGSVDTALGLGDFHSSAANAIAIRDDGVLDVAAADDTRIAIAQYLTNGSLDPAFADGEGVLVLGDFVDNWVASGIAIAADHSIRFVGTQSSQAMVGSVTASGFPDMSFADGGIAVMPAAANTFHTAGAMQLNTAGIVFVGGQSISSGGAISASFAAWRTSLAGTIDPSFGSSGVTLVPAPSNATFANLTSVAPQSTGAVVVLGYAILGGTASTAELLRFTSSGALDETFGTSGVVSLTSTEYAAAIAIQDDDRITIAGTNAKGAALWRRLPNGAVDTSFGDGGEVSLPCPTTNGAPECSGRAILIQPDGKIVTTGSVRPQTNDEMFVARIMANGSLDKSFGSGGIFIAQDDGGSFGLAIARATDGALLVAGSVHTQVSSHIGVWRLLP